MIKKLVILFLLSACAGGNSKTSTIKPKNLKLDFPISWSACSHNSDCTFAFDNCWNPYFINKTTLSDLNLLIQTSKVICYDLTEKPNVKDVVCHKQKCEGVFHK